MLKLDIIAMALAIWAQPPSGGCVLKQKGSRFYAEKSNQPPSGGCVLKLHQVVPITSLLTQPPSGGCVLKRANRGNLRRDWRPAAFGRLCVETSNLRF